MQWYTLLTGHKSLYNMKQWNKMADINLLNFDQYANSIIIFYELWSRKLKHYFLSNIFCQRSHIFSLKEKASQLKNCYNSIHCNFLFVNN
jgi:hypothetical protein